MQDIEIIFTQVAQGEMSSEEALSYLTRDKLECIISPAFKNLEGLVHLCQGRGILAGCVSGVLVLSREVAHALLAAMEKQDIQIDYIYSVYQGDVEDFRILKESRGFITTHPGQTTFVPVQATSENKPTIIHLPGNYETKPQIPVKLSFSTRQGDVIHVNTSYRALQIHDAHGTIRDIPEGTVVSIDGLSGNLYLGEAPITASPVERVYTILLACYLEATQQYGFYHAWEHLSETTTFANQQDELRTLIHTPIFQGFQLVKKYAFHQSRLKTFVTAHTPLGVATSRLYASEISFTTSGFQIQTQREWYGVGLIRDERMWSSPDEIDLLRLLLLGEKGLGKECWQEVRLQYLRVHTEQIYRLLAVDTGSIAVMRTLCMPYNRCFDEHFDYQTFALQYNLDPLVVANIIQPMINEREIYHGCRGLRLFCQREDIAELWLTAVLSAAMKVSEEGIPLQLRLLLATVTLPEEVQRFLVLFNRVSNRLFGETVPTFFQGISCMLETSGAYITLEEIFSQGSRKITVNGGLFGSNDFTAACLNFNRQDAPFTIIPGYIEKGIFTVSPFQQIHHTTVGNAIIQSLSRINRLAEDLNRPYYWGLAGELAGNWETIQWLTEHAAPLQLAYITTVPEHLVQALCAAAQASLQDSISQHEELEEKKCECC